MRIKLRIKLRKKLHKKLRKKLGKKLRKKLRKNRRKNRKLLRSFATIILFIFAANIPRDLYQERFSNDIAKGHGHLHSNKYQQSLERHLDPGRKTDPAEALQETEQNQIGFSPIAQEVEAVGNDSPQGLYDPGQ